ncbi:MAG: ParB/RepB/Spo0J family partition protein [Magnetovibrio sp.]|nr:ParB/RepB/Spo0J family partition protein [Magnetovibrio sp.]
MNQGKRKNLGRGLSALLGDTAQDYAELDRVRTAKPVPVDQLHPCAFQPRRRFDAAQIDELAASIREKGILQPLVVRRDPEDSATFEIICGERRWRAAQAAQLHELPVIIKELTDQETLEIALVENLQRENLSALEEAEAYQRLMAEFGHTQEDMAQSIGKSRSHVANMIRLINLPAPVKAMLEDGRLSAGHGRALLGAKNPLSLAKTVVQRGLNVRETENLVRRAGQPKKAAKQTPAKDADTIALENNLRDLLGVKATIKTQNKGGALTLFYKNLDQLDDLVARLSKRPE